MITLEQLSCFKTVYELNSYSKAARATNKTRATVRERVKALEDILGFELFETEGKSLVPTEQAHHLFPRAENLTRQSKEFYNVALSTFSTQITTVTLHHDDLVPLCLLSDIDDAIGDEFPDISVNWLQRDRKTSLDEIESGDATFAIMPTVGKIFPNTKVGLINLGTYRYGLYTSTNSSISNHVIDLNELTTEDFILTENSVLNEMRYANISNRKHLISNNDMLLHKIQKKGWTLLSIANAQPYVESGKLRKIEINEALGDLRQELVLFYPLNSEMDRTRRRIIEIAKECAKDFALSRLA
ncbi:LysR family transcriptional regulator [Vibrio tubiashii]|uniref:LysR family transcriptional regulator n=1 Tax=Vibrio tubiashii ATCC 19109 TaxID=1051646 RepID=F9T9N1_9VIBR|nr:LysR family transcriptional regulator [Vibrio tubiashii]AIW15624.1 LysR family transcriptional regulator [Vibrio tubiashii ATCC 19109]EGU51204.1 LysR family transcriptional regulator [Vibrio tubiashii ATCC 19109]EIF02597.1 LysR family transcriptional regulator [Vibrio tubiashii NCIMB 1337 = ATCC 19106]